MPQWRPQLPCCNPRWTSETLSNTHSSNQCTFWTNLISGTKFIAQTCIKVERFPHLGPPLLNFKSYLVSCSTLYAELKWRTETHQYKSSDIRLKLVTLLSQNQVRTTEESRVCPHESVAVRRRSVGGRSAAVPVQTQTYAKVECCPTFVLDTVLIPFQVSPRYFSNALQIEMDE